LNTAFFVDEMTHLSIFAEYRSYLFALASRILGNAMDAEDLLQETFLRWQQTPLAQIRSPKAFLSTVLKRLCLNHLQSARVRREESLDPLAPEPAASDNVLYQTLSERIAPALLVLLERLSPKERVVLLLRDVFDCEYEEIAPVLRKNAVACRQMLRRARQRIISERSRFVATPEQLQRLAAQFARACSSGDLKGLVSVLA
jgi:RNA polymerase sigma-70 factor (ECF subfamily)